MKTAAAVKRLTVLLAVMCLAATGVACADRPVAAEGNLSWQRCVDPALAGAGIYCAQLAVPADWRDPDGVPTSIGLAKLPAQDPGRRIGSLLVNLGGPGPMIQSLPALGYQLRELTRWFDVIAFDPRGLGTSSKPACPGAPNLTDLVFFPDRVGFDRFGHANRQWAQACQRAAGPLAGNLDAWQVAHDMDAIRARLGEGGLFYYGNSYGTVYGQTYADLFPTRVQRMFLDSVSDHTTPDPVATTAPMAAVIRDKFRGFAAWCRTDPACALHPTDPRVVVDELMARASRQPLPAPGAAAGQTVNPDQLRVATLSSVPRPSRWPRFAESLAAARGGDASGLSITPPSEPTDTSASRLAVCSDFPFTGGYDAMAGIERELRGIAPRVGWLVARSWYGRCAGITDQGSFPPQRIDPQGLVPVLLVNGTRDQTTPPAGARAVASQLPGSMLLKADTDHAGVPQLPGCLGIVAG